LVEEHRQRHDAGAAGRKALRAALITYEPSARPIGLHDELLWRHTLLAQEGANSRRGAVGSQQAEQLVEDAGFAHRHAARATSKKPQ